MNRIASISRRFRQRAGFSRDERSWSEKPAAVVAELLDALCEDDRAHWQGRTRASTSSHSCRD